MTNKFLVYPSISTMIELIFLFYSSTATSFGIGGVQDSTGDLRIIINDCRWYWSDNVGGTSGGGLEDSMMYFFSEEKSMITQFLRCLLSFMFSTMIELNVQFFLILQCLHSYNLTIMLIVVQVCYNI